MKNLKIIQSSDIHGYIYSHNYVDNQEQGILSFHNYINELKKDNEVLLIDTGDMYQGSPLTHVIDKFKRQEEGFTNPLTDVLNYMNYDIYTLGNHDFNFGLKYLSDSLKNYNGDILVANAIGVEEYINSKPYEIYNYGNKKIAVIGLVTSFIPNWEKPEHIKGIKFKSIIETYSKYEEELKEKSDFIIVNYHGGFEFDLEDLDKKTEDLTNENDGGLLIKKFDSIDLLLTGHQHREISTRIGKTVCTQPSNHGKMISETTYDSSLQLIDNKLVKSKEQVLKTEIKSIQELEDQTQLYLDKVVGKLDEEALIGDIFEARVNSHPLVNFIHDVQLYFTKADISAMNLFDTAVGFSKDVTLREIIANYPFPNTLKVLKISFEDLKQVLEITASYFDNNDGELNPSYKFSMPKPQHYNYDMFYGVNYEIDTNKEIGNRVTILNEKELKEKPYISIVVNNYRASNYAWYPTYKGKEVLEEINLDTVELISKYFELNEEVSISKEISFKIKK